MTLIGSGTPDTAVMTAEADYPAVSIIIVGYNSRAHLNQSFTALQTLDYRGPIQTIFVDNRSDDESVSFVREHFPGVHVIASDQNLGYAGGNNRGVQDATGQILVFLNPDTEVTSDWLGALVRPLLSDPHIGLTTSKILMMSDRARINTCGNAVSLSGITWCRGAGEPADQFSIDSYVPAVSGCSFAIRAELFDNLGGFDERFFMYLEDTDLSWRARAAGFRCRYVADSIVYHDYSLTLTPWKVGLIERNRYRMLAKHLSMRGVLALAPALATAEVLTWGYATLHGPRFLFAKARATAWALTQVGPVFSTQWRPLEGTILREHEPAPPVVDSIGGRPSRLAQQTMNFLTKASAALSFRLLPSVRSVDVMSTADRPGAPLKTEGQLDDPSRLEADQQTVETTSQ